MTSKQHVESATATYYQHQQTKANTHHAFTSIFFYNYHVLLQVPPHSPATFFHHILLHTFSYHVRTISPPPPRLTTPADDVVDIEASQGNTRTTPSSPQDSTPRSTTRRPVTATPWAAWVLVLAPRPRFAMESARLVRLPVNPVCVGGDEGVRWGG